MTDMNPFHFHCPREGRAEQRSSIKGSGMMKTERIQRPSSRLDCASKMFISLGRHCAGCTLYRQGISITIGTTPRGLLCVV
jgi:hypothetical protein